MQGLSGALWPVHPHRFPDELLSFWLLRLAHGNGLKLQTFTTLSLGRNASLWNRDIDRSATDVLLSELSFQTGSTVDEIKGGMLSAYEGILFHHANPNGNTPWILPLGIYHRKRRDFGMQFCPLCLFEDVVPYFRRHWRLALATVCDRHNTLLHDRCPSCGAPIAWFRNDLGHRRDFILGDHTLCSQCGFDFRRASTRDPRGIDGQSLVALQSLLAFHDFGWWFCNTRPIQYGPLFFDVLRHLVTWLSSRRGQAMREAIRSATGWEADVAPHVIFEFRPLAERHQLLAATMWLLQDWPLRFVELANHSHLSQSHILLGNSHPFWFESAIRENLSAGFYVPTSCEAAHAAQWLRDHARKPNCSSVGKLVGSKDAEAVRAYALPPKGSLSDIEFWDVMHKLSAESRRAPLRSLRQALLRRDRAMFIIDRLSKQGPSKIRNMTLLEGAAIGHNLAIPKEHRHQIRRMLSTYLQRDRPVLMKGRSGEYLFPSIKTGRPICPQEWRNRQTVIRNIPSPGSNITL